MHIHTHTNTKMSQAKPDPTGPSAEMSYDEWLAQEIKAGRADIEAGRVTPADEVWKQLGLE